MRILHTMLRVGNLDKSIEFYTEVLGMKMLQLEKESQALEVRVQEKMLDLLQKPTPLWWLKWVM